MGRGGGGKGRGGGGGGYGGDKQAAFFGAVRNEKEDTIRWSINHGGLSLATSDEDGMTPIMLAASLGKAKAMYALLDVVRKMRERSARSEALDAVDEEGRTALILAAAAGKLECAEMLREAGANLNIRDEKGYTARAWAEWSGNQDMVDVIDGKKIEEDDGPDSAAESDGGFEGETSTQRSRRKKKEMAGAGAGALTCGARREKREGKDDDGASAAVAVDKNAKPVLEEVEKALQAAAEEQKKSGYVKELSISLVRKEKSQAPGLVEGQLDPALWRCGPCVRHLEVRWSPGLAAGSLDLVGALGRLLHLIVQDSGLPALPEAIGTLKELRSLEVDGNALTDFPASLAKVTTLESLSAVRNKLTSKCLQKLAPIEKLASVKLDQNAISDVEDLDLHKKPHLVTLSLAQNSLTELPEDCWGDLAMLQHLNVSGNKIKELPCEMGVMKEKKFTQLMLDDNPWKDGKIRTMIENSAVLSNTVLVYLRKMKPKGNKRGGGKKKKAKAESSSEAESEDEPAKEEADEEEAEEAAPAPAAGGGGKKNKKKGR
eukprot:TRINITY_DN10291_c0_g1_i1.p1 TRINITY_DN10291_c0_g1~~TRINITY_DN10291_c0_g1_i1.p1  ORF type:complete len:545 (-),score=186.19 TRINITY_DN10291_c0_g1_i1:113-1747(-)